MKSANQSDFLYNNIFFLSKQLVILIPLLFILSVQLPAQSANFISRYIKRLVNDTTNIREPQFIAYPTLAFAPETRWEFGLSSLYVYYAQKDTTNRLSEIYGFTFYTLERQYGLWADHSLYTRQNSWTFLGRVRYQNFPLLYYGIGPHTAPQYLARVDAQQLNIKERVLKKLKKNFFVGPEIDLQQLWSVRFVPHDQNNLEKPMGSEGSFNLGFGGGILYDNRHNVLNVRDGGFAELALLHYDKRWGSTYSFTSIISDNRLYKPVNKRDVFAAQLFGQFTIGQPPFNQLSMLGGESLMRGYYTGRFRDRNQLAAQIEYRMLPIPFAFTKRLGATVFAGTGTVFDHFKNITTRDIVWAGGVGLRFLLFPKKDIFSRVDMAFTKEGRGIYIFIGEAF
jgi:hypothetical protein